MTSIDGTECVDALGAIAPFDWRDHLKVHAAADQFPLMSETDPKALQELAEDIRKNGLQTPIVLVSTVTLDESGKRTDTYTQSLLDGRNRLDALQLLGWLVPVERPKKPFHRGTSTTRWHEPFRLIAGDDVMNVMSGDDLFTFEDDYYNDGDDGFLYSISASLNLHRRHLTAEYKRKLIAGLLKRDPAVSDRQIAERTRSSPTTVGKIRAEKEASGDVSSMDTRTDTKGRKQPTKRKKPTPEQVRERAIRQKEKKVAAIQATLDNAPTEPKPEPSAVAAFNNAVDSILVKNCHTRNTEPIEPTADASAESRKALYAEAETASIDETNKLHREIMGVIYDVQKPLRAWLSTPRTKDAIACIHNALMSTADQLMTLAQELDGRGGIEKEAA